MKLNTINLDNGKDNYTDTYQYHLLLLLLLHVAVPHIDICCATHISVSGFKMLCILYSSAHII